MEIYYRPYRRNIREVLSIRENAQLFSQNLLTHLRNISTHVRNTAPKAKRAIINAPTNAYHVGSGLRFYTKVLIKYTRKLVGLTPFLDIYDAVLGYYVKDFVKFMDEVVKWGVIKTNSARRKYRARHLTNSGEAPVIVNIGLSSDSRDNITFSGDFKRVISRNQKKGGVVIINSAGTYYGSADYAEKIGGRVALSSNNGALVTVMTPSGRQAVLQDKKIPSDTVKALYTYLSQPANRGLMKDYYMVVEGDVDNGVTAVDFAGGKVRLSNSKHVSTSEAEVLASLNNAYGVRFVAKASYDLNRGEGKRGGAPNTKLDKGAQANARLASTGASILASLPEPLFSQLSKNVDVQFGRNGSVDLVPKDCSKLRAAELIADYYGIDRGQILNIATSVNDVCAPVSLNAIADSLKKGVDPKNVANDCIKIDDYLIENSDRLCIPEGFIKNYNLKNLTTKFDHDLVDANRRRHEEILTREFDEYVNEEREKLSQIVEASRQELDAIDLSTEENKEKHQAIKKKVEFAINTFNTNVANKRAELDARPIENEIRRSKYMGDNFFDLARKINGLSKNTNYQNTPSTPTPTPSLSA